MLRHGCGYALANAGHDTRAYRSRQPPPIRAMNSRRAVSGMGSPSETRCASLQQAQDAPEAPAGPWGSPELF
jgi:hypothetical protein